MKELEKNSKVSNGYSLFEDCLSVMLQRKAGRSKGRGHHNAWKIYGSAASLTHELSWDMTDGSLGEIRTGPYPLLEHPSPALSPPLPHALVCRFLPDLMSGLASQAPSMWVIFKAFP